MDFIGSFWRTNWRIYDSYRAMQRLEHLGTSPKTYGMAIQNKRKKKKRK